MSDDRTGPARPSPIDVLIAHPEPAGRASLHDILRTQPHVRVVAAGGEVGETAAVAERLRPAVILLDDRVTTPDGIGALACRSRVILLTGATGSYDVATLLRMPARGYLVYGNFEPADLLSAVDAVARGLAWMSPVVAAAAVAELRASATRACPSAEPAAHPLARRERQVLDPLTAVLSNAAAAAKLRPAGETVRNHLRRGLAKLGGRDRATAESRRDQR
ncbi:LuxR C-terminal-related transcriptional regulator [Paractinoplanes abujensis]|uniref:DNA-binding NarL/FixJ family response regulator n=1 Tax=Paractinoplanes abujensis TaxID=882441 RepID=A0A7W7G2L3_9ACTN|nr:LuxR C-terminal-related transcriptional regulator [Actinoplanes abujensis]MBB4693280.1 DNA-binding NarL/FixJ family response regulator [Actinoplanes abujensis]